MAGNADLRGFYPDRVFSRCPVCGAEGFAVPGGFALGAEGQHAFVCPSCAFRYYINSAVGTAAMLVRGEDEILLVRRLREPHMGTLDLPGGFAAPGEPSEEALVREVAEEVNLTVTAMRPWPKTYCNEYLYGGITYFTTDSIYLCSADDWSTLDASDPTEAEPLLVRVDELDVELIGLPSLRRAAYDILSTYRQLARPDGESFGRWTARLLEDPLALRNPSGLRA
jgi:NAD+ diphosphatase